MTFQCKNQWLENCSIYIVIFPSHSLLHSLFQLSVHILASFLCRRIDEWIILKNNVNEKHKTKLQNLFGSKDNKEEKRDINYSWKQEQQIPIKNDCQMPSCFKCMSFVRFVIFISFFLTLSSSFVRIFGFLLWIHLPFSIERNVLHIRTHILTYSNKYTLNCTLLLPQLKLKPNMAREIF